MIEMKTKGLANNLSNKNHADVELNKNYQPDKSPTVAILLCTMQGQHFLSEQLESIFWQTYTSWTLWVSDDGSSDGTHAILANYQSKWGENRFSIHSGPAEGFVANFLSLTCNANITAEYYAYSDQDDIWEADKLSRALKWLETTPSEIPALYCSRTCNVDRNNNLIGFSRLFSKPPSFANALVQSIGGGNTMVFNDAARRLLRAAGVDVNVASHDWWVYMVVSGCGGRVYYDPQPSVRYRQHETNLIGATGNWKAKLGRVTLLMQGRFKRWNSVNVAALQMLRVNLTPENKYILDEFSKARHSRFFSRLIGMRRSGVYRQTLVGNIGLIVATIFGLI